MLNEALRGHRTASSGTRPAALKEPVPQGRWPGALRQLGHVVPSLALPSQAGATADGVDSSSLRFLTAAALRKLKEEEMVMMLEDEEEEVEATAPAVSAAPAPVEEYVAHAPAVSSAPAPVVEYVAHAPAVFAAPAPVDMFVAPALAVSAAPAPLEEYIAPAPAVSAAPAPVVEYTAHAPAVSAAPAPMEEYVSPSPAVFAAPAPMEEYIAPSPAVFAAPAPGRGGGARGGLQGLSQGQGSTAVYGAEHVDTPVPHGGDLHGLSQGQGSTALCGADHVDIPVPQGRVGKRGLQGFPRGQSSTASAVGQNIGVDRGGLPRQSSTASAGEQSIVPACGGLQGLTQGQGSAASAGKQTIVPSRGDEVTLLFRKTTESRPQLLVHARKTRPLHLAFKAYCRRFGLQGSQVRFYCDGLLSPEHSPGLLGLEDGDVIEAEEVFEEDEDEDEEDEDMDELDGTQSRFPDGFLPMRMCRWFPSGNCRQGWRCMFAHSVSELHPLSHEHDL